MGTLLVCAASAAEAGWWPSAPEVGEPVSTSPGCPRKPDAGLEEEFNFGLVRPGQLLRSRKPSKAFLKYLKRDYGLKTIVDLRNPDYKDEGRDMQRERAWAEELGLRWVPATVSSLDATPQRELLDKLLAEPGAGPILVHCHGGKDRTGATTALVRLGEGWSYEEAALEMRAYRHDPDKDAELHALLRKRFEQAGAPTGVRPEWAGRLARPRRCGRAR